MKRSPSTQQSRSGLPPTWAFPVVIRGQALGTSIGGGGSAFAQSPCINGVIRLIGDDSWYDRDASAKVAALASSDPSIKQQYVQRVTRDHDFDFVQTVLDRADVDREVSEERITK